MNDRKVRTRVRGRRFSKPVSFRTVNRLRLDLRARSCFSGIAIKQVAANLPNGENLVSAASQAMLEWEDDYCGIPARPVPTLTLAASLAAFASILQKGELQIAIQEEASRIAQKAFAASTVAQPPGIRAAWC